ncbi:MAG TPA: hypothetical protein VE572_06730, partial [Nitrososphaeraceae archaeon]|nr:hypothetical protein [Nitrososphaeraceae archaeon]
YPTDRLEFSWERRNGTITIRLYHNHEIDYQKLPLSEHVNSAPQLRHLRWQTCKFDIVYPQRRHCILLSLVLSEDIVSII